MSKPSDPPDPGSVPPWLEDGMHAAFGPAPADPPTRSGESLADMLDALESVTGSPSCVFLRDEPEEAPPILRPVADESYGEDSKYSVQGEIARGGVGVVFKGHDRDLGRDVALKVLREEYRSNPSVLQRFVEEAQIGGQLQHPGIVPVYDLGVDRGRPFFTMKLIKGRTLAALLEERRDPSVDLRRILDIYEAVCQTVAYAHARGVIHRDLKPANVMVGAFGEVQVVDWGLAKVLRAGGTSDERRAARKEKGISVVETVRSSSNPLAADSVTGSVMGTPSYMPPEQANGDVERMDERSDVFSLGAVLCEILTGLPPYPHEGEEAMQLARRCKTDEALRRLRASGVDEELVELCVECFQPAPAGRPRSAQVLADRIGTYLHSVEERAQRARIDAAEQRVHAEGARKARRLTIGLAATVLAAGGLGMWAYLTVDREARDRRARVTAKIESALSEVSLRQAKGDHAGALEAARRAKELLSPDIGVDLHERVKGRLAAATSEETAAEERAALVAGNATLLRELADVRLPEGHQLYPTDWAAVSRSYRRVFTAAGLSCEGPEADVAAAITAREIPRQLASHVTAWAQAEIRAENRAEAVRLTRIADTCDDDPRRRELRAAFLGGDPSALRRFANRDDLASWPPATLELLGSALVRREAWRSALRVYRVARRAYPGDFVLTLGLARALRSQVPARAPEAVEMFEAAVALQPNSVEARHELGITLEGLRRYDRAREVYADAVAVSPNDGHLWSHLGLRQARVGDFDRALESYEKAVRLRPEIASAHVHRGDVFEKQRKFNEALECYRKAVEVEPGSELAHHSLVDLLSTQGRFDDVLREYRERLETEPARAEFHWAVGEALRARKEFPEAAAEYRAALRLRSGYGRARYGLGCCLERMGKREEAIDMLRSVYRSSDGEGLILSLAAIRFRGMGCVDDALASLRAAVAQQPDGSTPHRNLALLLMQRGEYEEAVQQCRRSAELDPRHPKTYYHLGSALVAMGSHTEAREAFDEACRLQPKSFTLRCAIGTQWARHKEFEHAVRRLKESVAMNDKYPQALCNLGLALTRSGHAIEALPYLRKGHALGSKQKNWRDPSDEWLRQAQVAARDELRLVDVLEGDAEPVDAVEILRAATLARQRSRFPTAVRLAQRAFDRDAACVEDLEGAWRYDAACAAVAGGMGRGAEAQGLDASARAKLRLLALEWLALEVAALAKSEDPDFAAERLRRMRDDVDLAAVRDARFVCDLPEREQVASRNLWNAVERALRRFDR